MSPRDKPLAWLSGEIKTPPFGSDARIEAGFLLRGLQRGESLGLPESRPMPSIGPGCHELRIVDGTVSWRMYHIAADAVVILDVFKKQTETTPLAIINACKQRLADFGRLAKTKEKSRAKG